MGEIGFVYLKITEPFGQSVRLCVTGHKGFLFIEVLLPTDAQRSCFQRNIKIYVKITRAVTCFGVITIISERTV